MINPIIITEIQKMDTGYWSVTAQQKHAEAQYFAITKFTDYLVVGKQNPKCLKGDHTRSIKQRMADKRPNLKVISEEDFKIMVGYEAGRFPQNPIAQ